jgi:hypothetical protein
VCFRGFGLWLWPLPPAEAFEFAVEWSFGGIDLTIVELGGAAIVVVARGRPLLARDRERTLTYGPSAATDEDQRRSAVSVAKPVAKALDGVRRAWTNLEYRPSPRPVTDGSGRLAYSHGSEGWGFESPPSALMFSQASALFSEIAEELSPLAWGLGSHNFSQPYAIL